MGVDLHFYVSSLPQNQSISSPPPPLELKVSSRLMTRKKRRIFGGRAEREGDLKDNFLKGGRRREAESFFGLPQNLPPPPAAALQYNPLPLALSHVTSAAGESSPFRKKKKPLPQLLLRHHRTVNFYCASESFCCRCYTPKILHVVVLSGKT